MSAPFRCTSPLQALATRGQIDAELLEPPRFSSGPLSELVKYDLQIPAKPLANSNRTFRISQPRPNDRLSDPFHILLLHLRSIFSTARGACVQQTFRPPTSQPYSDRSVLVALLESFLQLDG